MLNHTRNTLNILLCAVLAAFLFSGLWGCGKDEPIGEEEIIRPVKFFKIAPLTSGSGREYAGIVSAAQEVTIAFEVPGRIIQMPVKEGQNVKKGEFLAALDPENFQIVLNSRNAELNTASADYERLRALYDKQIVTKRDLDAARRNYQVAKSNAQSAQKALNDTRITAPFAGQIAQTLVKKFQNIQAKQPVLILQDNSSLEVKVDIPEQDYAGVGKQTSLSELTDILKPEIIVSSVPDKTFNAWFKETATLADPATRTFEVTLGFDSPASVSILPGMTARLIITGSLQPDAQDILIPANAVLSDDDGNATVWLISPETHTVRRVVVEPGEMTGAGINIKKGLEPGDIIAASGVHQLRQGEKIREYMTP